MTLETTLGSCYIYFLDYLKGLLKIEKGLASRRTMRQREQKGSQKQLWMVGVFFSFLKTGGGASLGEGMLEEVSSPVL